MCTQPCTMRPCQLAQGCSSCGGLCMQSSVEYEYFKDCFTVSCAASFTKVRHPASSSQSGLPHLLTPIPKAFSQTYRHLKQI